MRHRKANKSLGRYSSHRKSMFYNMVNSMIMGGYITTTVVKAKELRRYLEPMVTLAKTDSVSLRRLAFSVLRNRDAVTKLFTELAPKFKERPGGYVRVLKSGFRAGDSAPMAYVKWV